MNPFNDKITRATRHMALMLLASFVLVSCSGSSPTPIPPSGINTGLVVIASGTVGPNGGTVADSSGETAVIVPPGAVSTDTTIQILRERNADGNVVTNFSATPPTSGQVRLVLPDEDVLEASMPPNSGITTQGVQAAAAVVVSPEQQALINYPNQEWLRLHVHKNFWDSAVGRGFGNRVDERTVVDSLKTFTLLERISGTVSKPELKQASGVWSTCREAATECYQGKTAVLFVHGYLPQVAGVAGLGGGYGTWGQFPILLHDAGYVPFEFRWNTAARFQDVARDLCQAVDYIAEHTGKQIHVVAHSFGGVLTRVYLQNLASGPCKYRGNVASVTTLGSPHSGIFEIDTPTNFGGFRPGQDSQQGDNLLVGLPVTGLNGSGQMEFCQQLSCFQAGENIKFGRGTIAANEETARTILGVRPSAAGEIAELLAQTHSDLGKTDAGRQPLPIQVLIGLSSSRGIFQSDLGSHLDAGDGLISYEGQRFLPNSTWGKSVGQYDALLNGALFGLPITASVTEQILGFSEDVQPGYPNPLPFGSANYWGYRHSAFPVIPHNAKTMANTECTVLASSLNCSHSGFDHVYSWITDPAHQAGLATNGPKFTLRVRILDANTSNPIVGASVQVKSGGYAVGDIAPTNQDGYAVIQVRFLAGSGYSLVVTRAGYNTKEFPSILNTGDSQVDIEIPPKALTPETSTAAVIPVQFSILQVAGNGTGSGSITGNGIACPADCATTEKSGTTIVLSAKAEAGSLFNGWSGCTSSQAEYCFITLDVDKVVTALFTATGATPVIVKPALSITTTSLPSVVVGTGYAQGVAVSGGQTPYFWSVSSGLPSGMNINSTTGAIYGYPSISGTFSFTVTATDSSNPQKTTSQALSLTVTPGPTTTPSPCTPPQVLINGVCSTPPVTPPTTDATPPTVNVFTVNSSTVLQGQSFVINYTVSDSGGSGLKQIGLWRANVNGAANDPSWRQIGVAVPLSGNTHSGVFTDAPPTVGNYWYGIHVIDNANPTVVVHEATPLAVTVASSVTLPTTPPVVVSPPVVLSPTVISVSPSLIPQGIDFQNVTITGTNFTPSSYHQLSIDGGITWNWAANGPIFNSSTSTMTVSVNNRIVRTTRIRVCASNGSSNCSTTSVAVTILPVTTTTPPVVVLPPVVVSPPVVLSPTVISVSPSLIPQGIDFQNVTITGTNFTPSSYHQLSIDGGITWNWAANGPIFNSSTSTMTVSVNNRIVRTTRIRVCASNGSSNCSTTSVAVTILPVATTQPPAVVLPPVVVSPPVVPTLVVNGVASSYIGTGQKTIPLTGSGLLSITQISWSCTKPGGTSCGVIPSWIPGTARWGNVALTSNTAATIFPTFLVASDPLGTYNWSITFSGGGQSVKKFFTVTK